MTSKNLFFRLVRQDIKKRIWCPIVIFITYFLILEVHMLMELDSIYKYAKDREYDLLHYIPDTLFGTKLITFSFIICATAFMCALGGFSYLHSKPQVDIYHSMPVSRTKLFWVQYISGILQCFIPLVFHVLVCLAIAASRSLLNTQSIVNSICFVGTELFIFFMVYSAVIAAVCLTGNLIISILGAGALFSYSTLIALLKGALFEHFFHTYISFGYEERLTVSPLGLIIRLKKQLPHNVEKGTFFSYNSLWQSIMLILIAVVIYTAAAFVLYRKRPSESAGKAIAFSKVEPILKTLIVLPAMLLSGLFFAELSGSYASSEQFRWFLFGAFLGFVIVCLLVEIAFRMDIRCALEHKKQFAFNAACAVLIVVIFRYDVLGYNTYVPLEKQMQSCAVSIDGLMEIAPPESITRNWYRYSDIKNYRLQTMHIEKNPSVMKLIRKAAKEGLHYKSINYYIGIEESQEYKELVEQQKNYTSITVGYNLLNGSKVYRHYIVDLSDTETVQLISEIFSDYQYKLGSVPMLSAENFYQSCPEIVCTSNFHEQRLRLNVEQQSTLSEIYQKELLKLTFEEAASTIPVGTICFLTKEDIKYHNYYNGYSLYDIYPQFTETIALIRKYGFDFNASLSVEEISEIRVRNYKIEAETEENFTDDNDYAVYTQKDKMKAIIEQAVNDRLEDRSFSYIRRLLNEEFGIEIVCTDGQYLPYGYTFRVNHVPDFVEKDVGEYKN